MFCSFESRLRISAVHSVASIYGPISRLWRFCKLMSMFVKIFSLIDSKGPENNVKWVKSLSPFKCLNGKNWLIVIWISSSKCSSKGQYKDNYNLFNRLNPLNDWNNCSKSGTFESMQNNAKEKPLICLQLMTNCFILLIKWLFNSIFFYTGCSQFIQLLLIFNEAS